MIFADFSSCYQNACKPVWLKLRKKEVEFHIVGHFVTRRIKHFIIYIVQLYREGHKILWIFWAVVFLGIEQIVKYQLPNQILILLPITDSVTIYWVKYWFFNHWFDYYGMYIYANYATYLTLIYGTCIQIYMPHMKSMVWIMWIKM